MSAEGQKEVNQEFGRLRSFLWPIHGHELKKLLPMFFMFFLISFSYNVLRTLKDTVLVTAKSSGAEVIPFVKVWVMFPGAILMTLLFTRLSGRISREQIFYAMIGLFLSFFFVFAFVLIPMGDSIHLHGLADSMQSVLPAGAKGFVAMIRYWSFSLFYAMSELWGNIVLFLLFWGFANEVTKVHEAKRFYGLFGVGANLSGIVAGSISIYFCNYFGPGNWEQTLATLVGLVILSGVFVLGLYRWMNQSVLTDERFYTSEQAASRKQKHQMSMRENISYLLKSPYLLSIAVIVLAYNLIINLVEVLWKHHVKLLYSDPALYTLYMNKVTIIIGIIATFTALFISGNSLRRFGWTVTANLTPIILLATSIAFFLLIVLGNRYVDLITLSFGMTPLALTVLIGTLQNCLSRAAKYSVYDSTKEMAFIPLAADVKIKGKSVIDGVCTRLGKSGGAVTHQFFLILFGSLTMSAPYIFGVLFGVLSVWIFSVNQLGKKFNELTGANSSEEVSDQPVLQEVNNKSDSFQEQEAI